MCYMYLGVLALLSYIAVQYATPMAVLHLYLLLWLCVQHNKLSNPLFHHIIASAFCLSFCHMRSVFCNMLCHYYEKVDVNKVQSSDCWDGRQDILSILFWHCWWYFRMDRWMDTCVCSGTEFCTLNLCWEEEHNICFVVIFIFVFSCLILVVEPNKMLKNIVYSSKIYGGNVCSFNVWDFFL
jgi:hypothetical protein